MMKKFLGKQKRHADTTETTEKFKEDLKVLDDKISASISKISRQNANLTTTCSKSGRDLIAVSEVLIKLANKDLTKDGEDAAFELFKDASGIETEWATRTNDEFVNPVNIFVKQELNEQTKVLKKQYERSTSDYSSALSKVDSLHTKKSADGLKLYVTEKERVKTKKTFDDSTTDLRNHIDDLNERVHIEFFERLVTAVEAQKAAFGKLYTDIDGLNNYLAEMVKWCGEEKLLFQQSQKERMELRKVGMEQEETGDVLRLIQELDSATVDIARTALKNALENSMDIMIPLVVLCNHYQHPIPSHFDSKVQTGNMSAVTALEQLRNGLKGSIDAIGTALLTNNQQEKLISLCDALASFEGKENGN